MTLDDIAARLPNGFHDAELNSVTIDYVHATARLVLDIWIAEKSMGEEGIETYRLAAVTLSGLLFWINQAPHPEYDYDCEGGIRIDLCELGPDDISVLPPIPDDAFANGIFVDDWNARIYLAARHAELEWLAEKTVRERPEFSKQ